MSFDRNVRGSSPSQFPSQPQPAAPAATPATTVMRIHREHELPLPNGPVLRSLRAPSLVAARVPASAEPAAELYPRRMKAWERLMSDIEQADDVLHLARSQVKRIPPKKKPSSSQ